jgi:hypothetical protein
MNGGRIMPEDSPAEHSRDERVAKLRDNCVTRGDAAPLFRAQAYLDGGTKQIVLSDYKGDWVVLFFYSSDFTFV